MKDEGGTDPSTVIVELGRTVRAMRGARWEAGPSDGVRGGGDHLLQVVIPGVIPDAVDGAEDGEAAGDLAVEVLVHPRQLALRDARVRRREPMQVPPPQVAFPHAEFRRNHCTRVAKLFSWICMLFK